MYDKATERVYSDHLNECGPASGRCQFIGEAENLTLTVLRYSAIGQTFTHRHLRYYSAIRLILILPSRGGWKAESK